MRKLLKMGKLITMGTVGTGHPNVGKTNEYPDSPKKWYELDTFTLHYKYNIPIKIYIYVYIS